MSNDGFFLKFSELNLIGCHFGFSGNVSSVLIDVGAHRGSVSSLFLKKGWTVVAFEPEQINREALLRKIPPSENFTCIAKAVSDVTGTKVPFYVSQEHYGIHSIKPWHPTHQPAYEVETIRLDDALQELNINHVTLLKVDIEGADFLALKGFDFDRLKPELVMVEFMDERTLPNFGYTHHDIVTYMQNQGYSTFVSEWAPIKEYGRESVKTAPHQWLQCIPYPLDHEPAWGNLIFVPHGDEAKFTKTLVKYLQRLKLEARLAPLKTMARKLLRIMSLHKWVKRQ